jgi:hypothetical protein
MPSFDENADQARLSANPVAVSAATTLSGANKKPWCVIFFV